MTSSVDPSFLADTDKREKCSRCGWVGRRAFQQDRHDLCEEELTGEDENEVTDLEDIKPQQDQSQSVRQRGIPSKRTLAVKRITQLELATGRAELEALGGDEPYERPKIRGECQWCPVCQLVRDSKSDGLDSLAKQALEKAGRPRTTRRNRLVCGHKRMEAIWHSRPCVFIACKYGLYLDVSGTGSIVLNFPHLEPGQLPADQSCSLDLAERGEMTLEDIATATNLTRERIRQIELKALTNRARTTALEMGLTAEDAATIGMRYRVGPGAELEDTGAEGTLLSDFGEGQRGRDDDSNR